MKNLVGQSFSLAENRYRIVDVQRLGKDALVYAERLAGRDAPAVRTLAGPPERTAFHYGDIAGLLDAPQPS